MSIVVNCVPKFLSKPIYLLNRDQDWSVYEKPNPFAYIKSFVCNSSSLRFMCKWIMDSMFGYNDQTDEVVFYKNSFISFLNAYIISVSSGRL